MHIPDKGINKLHPTFACHPSATIVQLVMVRTDQVNPWKDDLTIAVKALAHNTAKPLVSVYSRQQALFAKLAKRMEELEKQNAKT